MYLEISPRQSGKTTRLVEAILSHPGPVTIISGTREQSRSIENMIRSHTRVRSSSTPNIVYVSASSLSVINFKSKIFIDEFDCFDKEIWHRFHPPSIEAGYFVTTARRFRSLKDVTNSKKDMLCRLLQINGFEYKTYPTLMPSSALKAAEKQYEALRFALEIEGRFVNEQSPIFASQEKAKLERRIVELEEQLRVVERSW